MKKINFIQLIKIGIGSCISILIASALGLNYSPSAGIITLLSIQNTKKETLFIAFKRFLAFGLSLLISNIAFGLLGYHPYSFGFFLFLFLGSCYLLKLEDGISMNAVLATHFLIEKSMSFYWVKNELLLLIIGAGIAVLLNLYIPNKITSIRQDQQEIEEKIKELLESLSLQLLKKPDAANISDKFLNLDMHLKEALARTYENMNNTLLSDTSYYLQYMQMRKSQIAMLKRIHRYILNLDKVPKQAYPIASYIQQMAITFHEYNNAVSLLEELDTLMASFQSDALPKDRPEFENRAILFQVMNELEAFLILKKEFVESLTDIQIKKYWQNT